MPKNLTHKLGQHFLQDKQVLRKIIGALDVRAGETIVEIGPGHGELTDSLLIANSELRLALIEKDEKLATLLKEKYKNSANIEIILADALRALPVLTKNLQPTNYNLVGNLPYYITGRLLRIIGELEHKPKLCVFTIQKEVAGRLSAAPPRMNLLAASVQIWAEPQIIATIPPSAFSPPPEVESAIIRLRTTPYTLDPKPYFKMLRILYKQPRKTILNNLADGLGKNKAEVTKKLRDIDINPGDRPQNLSVKELIEIAEIFAA